MSCSSNVDADEVARQQNADGDLIASLKHGCLKLGEDDAGEYNNNFELQQRQRGACKYVTLLRVDHDAQTSQLCRDVTVQQCIPCCPCGDHKERPVSWIWYLISSGLTVFTLHIFAIIFGVVKEALDMRHNEATKTVHFANTVVETVVAFLILVIQMLNTRMGYVKVRQAVERLEHFDPDKDAHLRSIRTWMWSAVAAGLVLIGVCVGCFFMFYEYVHLGWTVLSNQACIVMSLAIYGLYWSRVMTAIYTISADQHKVVIHEALMLLRDRCQDTGDEVTTSSSSSRAAALRFIEAVSHTKSLSQPKHINDTFHNQHRRC